MEGLTRITMKLDLARARCLARVSHARSIAPALSMSFASQAISSGTNFALGIFLVRFMDAASFGTYGIGIAVVLLLSGIGNALFLTQMVVRLPDKTESDRPGYLGRVLMMVSGLSAVPMILALLFALVERFAVTQRGGLSMLVMAASIAAAGYLLKDFFIRVCYSKRLEKVAFVITTVASVATLSAMIVAWHLAGNLTAAIGMAVYASGQLAGAAAGFIACRSTVRFQGLSALPNDLREAFEGGRWALGGVGVTWLQSQAYVYLTAIFVGPIGVGYANAARLFVSPLQLAMPAINQVTMPRMASLRLQGVARVTSIGRKVSTLVVLCGLAYVGLLALYYRPAADLILQGRYQGIGAVVMAWCLVLVMQLARDGASTILQALRKFRRLTVSSAAVAALSLPVVAVLAGTFGVAGAVAATALGECVLAIVLWSWIRRHAH